jgi:16S rRNA A1518/A1519 N6-dimethyltransferase RsmA/KsgA/DIM1 with predicted DNA glycosylase/AP lyase activity
MSDPTAVLEAAGVEPTARAEQLTPMDYVAIARADEQP